MNGGIGGIGGTGGINNLSKVGSSSDFLTIRPTRFGPSKQTHWRDTPIPDGPGMVKSQLL